MTNAEIMKVIAPVHNALWNMNVSQEQTLIVGDCVRALRSLLDELNKSASDDAEKK